MALIYSLPVHDAEASGRNCLLVVLPVPGVPPERTMLKGSPAVVLFDFAPRFPTGADPN
jgi:hypothetical protein